MTKRSAADPFDGYESWEKPHLRLFFSADIVGSTAMKQGRDAAVDGDNSYPVWFNTVLAFYHSAEQIFKNNWETFRRFGSGQDEVKHWFGPPPEIWKTVGDEVLFTKIVEHPIQATVAIHAWTKTLRDVTDQLREDHALTIKSSVWLADFPVRNQEIILGLSPAAAEDVYPLANYEALQRYYSEGEDRTGAIRDFVGPAIDTGFRLGAFASPRKLVLSVELAHMLSVQQNSIENGAKEASMGAVSLTPFLFRFEGKHPMKGVLGGNPYPVFWIDLAPEDPINRTEDAVSGAMRPTAREICEYTGALMNHHVPKVHRPYFSPNGNPIPDEFAVVPPDDAVRLEDRRARIGKSQSRVQAEKEAVFEEAGAPPCDASMETSETLPRPSLTKDERDRIVKAIRSRALASGSLSKEFNNED